MSCGKGFTVRIWLIALLSICAIAAAVLSRRRRSARCCGHELRRSLHALKISELNRPVTASFGVSAFPDDSTDPDHLIRTADRALYAAKQNGRDRVETVSKGDREDPERPQAETARAGNGAAAP